ncbi:MAG: hypothetical protein COB30_006655 [Ectothiorhodospiraceae bacterium]|nr:hypothetical protein [Ectothiorhodospiraceae bacterium]
MNALSIFAIEVSLCFALSAVIIVLIRRLLRDVLLETCGTSRRADFWVMFTPIMVVISPLLMVIYFAPTETDAAINVTQSIKDTLFRSLLGDIIALSVMGQVMWKSLGGNNIDVSKQSPILENRSAERGK